MTEKTTRAPGVAGLFTQQLAAEKAAPKRVAPVRAFPDASGTNKPLLASFKPAQQNLPETGEVFEIDPTLVEPWPFADRPEGEMGDFEELVEMIDASGQAVPGLVRPHSDKEGHYELIYGLRRWRAAKQLHKPFLCLVKNLDDKAAFAAMDGENNGRKNLSSWAKAVSYSQAISKGLYKNESALAYELGISRGTLNNLMAYTRLPDDVSKAIGVLSRVSIQTVKAMLALLNDEQNSEGYKAAIIELAPQIRTGALTDKSLLRAVHSSEKPTAPDEAAAVDVTDKDGIKVGTIRRTRKGIQITLASKDYEQVSLGEISERLSKVLVMGGAKRKIS
ncbi:ParB/RepB/Spo0J family partition protein [Pseudomonas luteola]|uniref:ParB/RepB/Spo0J family partition protein n=1 Tax=Pseudomonas luteola TaxID=47886 RepID=UPI0028A260D0|nr:ParB/RepB/Spo0J family partition protein [Pseudomonas luteola]